MGIRRRRCKIRKDGECEAQEQQKEACKKDDLSSGSLEWREGFGVEKV